MMFSQVTRWAAFLHCDSTKLPARALVSMNVQTILGGLLPFLFEGEVSIGSAQEGLGCVAEHPRFTASLRDACPGPAGAPFQR